MYGITTSEVHLNNLGFHSGEITEEEKSALPSTDRYKHDMFEPFREQLNNLDYLRSTEQTSSEDNDPHVADSNEINWTSLKAASLDNTISFAGRYFVGHATSEEIANDTGFAFWAHGEASYEGLPDAIFPIQRANARWQQTTGHIAKQLATIDANATIDAVIRCFEVGDLKPPQGPSGHDYIFIYLEAAKGQLSQDYWQAWSQAILASDRVELLAYAEKTSLFLPCLIGDFELDPDTSEYWPEETIRTALNLEVEDGLSIFSSASCYSLWAVGDALKAHDFNAGAPIFKELFQDNFLSRSILPVDIWLTTQVASTSSTIPSFVTLHYIDSEVDDSSPYPHHPLNKALEVVKDWAITAPLPHIDEGNNTEHSLLKTWPTQVGIDNGRKIDSGNGKAAEVNASNIREARVYVKTLPCPHSPYDDYGTNLVVDNNYSLVANTSFVGRYLESGAKGTAVPNRRKSKIDSTEVDVLSTAGLAIVSTYQHVVTSNQQLDKNPVEHGQIHGEIAFNYAQSINQAPYTPIYFAIDLDVVELEGYPHLDQVVLYFREIRKAYQDYIAKENSIPYYIGVYSSAKAFNALYRAGLVSHFWQAAPIGWGQPEHYPYGYDNWLDFGTGWRAWPHANLWQIALSNPSSYLDGINIWTINEPKGSESTNKSNQFLADIYEKDYQGTAPSWTDLNVAWGNPGGWTQWNETMPHVPTLIEEE